MELWVSLERSPELYEISNMGNFRAKPRIDSMGRKRQERPLLLSTTKDGYKRANVHINGKTKHIAMHRLVYEAFIGPIEKGLEINHKNGIRDDNRPENLEAMTHADNIRYSKNVLGADYATYGNGRMTPEQRDKIFELRANGLTHRQIGKHVGFSKSQVANILNHKSWAI